MRKSYIIIFFLYALSFLFINKSYCIDDAHAHRNYLNFKIYESEFAVGKYVTGNIDSLKFTKYNWFKTPKTLPDSNRMLTLRAPFYVSAIEPSDNFYLAVMPIYYTCNIYLNGHLIITRGNLEYGTSSRIGHSSGIFLPPALLKFDTINEIALQLYPRNGENDPINKVFISSYEDVSSYVFKRNMFGSFAYQAITVCSFIIFIYYFLLFFFQRDYHKKHYLYFSFVNLFFVLMSLNSLIDFDFADVYLLERIVRTSIVIWAFWMMSFFVYYTNFFKKPGRVVHLAALVYLSSGFYIFIQPNTYAVNNAFNSFPAVFICIGVVFMLVSSILYLQKEKNIKAFVLFLVCIACIISSGYDMINFSILDRIPYAWFVPYAIFFSNISLFLLLAIEQAQIQRQLVIKADDLKFTNANLDSIVKERTVQLKVANATKDKFFSIIAHDLRNPFNALIGLSRLSLNLVKKKDYTDLEMQLSMIHESSKNAHALLENLLVWSRTQTNLIEYHPESFNVKSFANDAIESVLSQGSNKEINVINEISENHVIYADKNTVLTVFRNLLSNAIKYSYPKSVITLKSFDLNSHIEIDVCDNGTGILKEDIDKLFKIETKVSVQGTNDEIGTGLGLILCKEFIVRNSGEIWVESEAGIGSTFKFTLPKNT